MLTCLETAGGRWDDITPHHQGGGGSREGISRSSWATLWAGWTSHRPSESQGEGLSTASLDPSVEEITACGEQDDSQAGNHTGTSCGQSGSPPASGIGSINWCITAPIYPEEMWDWEYFHNRERALVIELGEEQRKISPHRILLLNTEQWKVSNSMQLLSSSTCPMAQYSRRSANIQMFITLLSSTKLHRQN